MDQYIGEIRMFGGNYAPMGWALCDGQLLNIAQNDVLYSLIGTTYGGDGINIFALPDFRGRIGLSQGTGTNLSPRTLGEKGGTETVVLTQEQLPAHTHPIEISNASGTLESPDNALWASSNVNQYSSSSPNGQMNSAAITVTGNIQPQAHLNMMPYLCVNFIIALEGIFPTHD